MFAHYFGVSALKAGFGLAFIALSLIVFYYGVKAWDVLERRWNQKSVVLREDWHGTVFVSLRILGAALVVFRIQASSLRAILSGENWHIWAQKAVFSFLLSIACAALIVWGFRQFDKVTRWFDIETALTGKDSPVGHGKSMHVVVWNSSWWLAVCYGGGELGSQLVRSCLPGF